MSAYSDIILAESSLALYWRLGESSGTNANDETANNRDGTYGSGVTLAQPGAIGLDANTAVALNGTSNGKVTSSYNPFINGTARTYEGWAYRNTMTGNQSLFGGPGNSPSLRVFSNSGDVSFQPDLAAGPSASWTAAWPGISQWVHWVLIFRENIDTAELFINGVSQTSKAIAQAYNASPGTFQIGYDLNNEPWVGRQDEVAVYTDFLVPADIEEHYQVGSQRYVRVREKPPLRFSVTVTNPSGNRYRWAYDEPDPVNAPSGLSHSDTMPGGFEQMSGTLPREPGIDYADLARLSTIQLKSVGGYVFGEYRLDSAPRTSGDQMAVSPAAVGWQAHLEDNKFARMVYRDIDFGAWTGASVQRRINIDGSGFSARDPSVQNDETTGAPSLRTGFEAPWVAGDLPDCVALYDARGISLGSLYYAWKKGPNVPAGPDAWQWQAALTTDDLLGTGDNSGDLQAAGPGSGTVTATASNRIFAFVQLVITSGAGTSDGTSYDVWWTTLAVYGNHGLTKRGAEPSAGFYGSDVVGHAVRAFAPLLVLRSDSIQQSSFVLPHLSFLEPTTAGEIVRQASRFDLPDWAVWADRVFYWNARGARARRWRARVGPAELQETGAQVERLWESIVVAYQDVDGSTRTVGPPGSGANTESANLKDYDTANPANQLGITRRDMLQMGVSTPEGAIEVGRRFLAESRLLDRSGKAKAVGWIEDDSGVVHPYWQPRAGDEISFVDAADTSYRRIVRSGKDHDSRTATFDLDAPPEGLQALLERLGVVLVPLGVGS